MQNIREAKEKFIQEIMNIVYKVLRKERVLDGEWRLGKVESVINPTKIKAFIDGGSVAQTISANPNVIFEIGDEIWIICPNRDSKSRFALCKRGLNYTNPPIDSNIEISNARTDTRGKEFTTLKGRLDSYDLEFGERGVNVKWFGAKGDGINDDTTAIQAALNEKGVVFLPKGTYKITSPLVIREGTSLIGASKIEASIVQHTNGEPILQIIGWHYKISNLHLVYVSQQTSSNSVGIRLGDALTNSGAYEGEISHIFIERPYRGIEVPTEGENKAFAFENSFEHIRVLNSTDWAFHIGGSGWVGLTTNTFKNCYALHDGINPQPSGKGFYIGNHDDFTMFNCAVDHAVDRALMVNYSKGTILDFHVESCHITISDIPMIQFNNSKMWIGNLEVLSCTCEIAGEQVVLSITEQSDVSINTYIQRQTMNNGNATLYSMVTQENAKLEVSYVEQDFSNYFPNGANIHKKIVYHHSKPTTGKWNRGDIIYNEYPNEEEPLGWVVCNNGDFSTGTLPVIRPFGYISQDLDEMRVKVVHESGATTLRPTTPIHGQSYFDTQLGKLIIWNQYSGGSGNWVDTTGVIV